MPLKTAVCTIVAKNYLPFARVLMSSVRRWNPDFLRIVVLVDRVDGCFEPAQEDFDLVLSEDLNIPQSRWFHFKYTILELSTAVKPYALEFLFQRYQLDRILYLDPDIKVYESLSHLLSMLEQNQIVLTPHLTGVLDDELRPSELDILRSGVYNLGFIGLAAGPETFRFLKWWQTRLYDHCVVDLTRGLFVDQRWVDLVPTLFARVGVNREPGYNVAYWNLNHRKVEKERERYRVNGQPLYFFHFSGFDPENPEEFSKHQNRYRLSDLRDARHLVLEYRADLYARGHSVCKHWPNAYGCFQNGVPIADMGRPIHHESPEVLTRIQDPFSDEGFRAFVDVWNGPIVGPTGERSGVTRLAYRIYRTRDDVQAAMPDVLGVDQLRFLEWMLSSGKKEHGLHDLFVTPIRAAVEGPSYDQGQTAVDHTRGERSGEATPAVAALYRRIAESGARDSTWLRPGEDAAQSCNERLNELIDSGKAGLRLSRLARAIYEARPDLQRFFPDPCGRNGMRFLLWFLTYGKKEYDLDEVYLAPLRKQWDVLAGASGSRLLRIWYDLLLFAAASLVVLRPGLGRLLSKIRHPGTALWRVSLHPAKGVGVSPLHSPNPLRQAPRSHSSSSELGLNLIGYLRAEMGVGQAARSSAMAARAAGLPVRLRELEADNLYRHADFSAGPSDDSFPFPFNLLHGNADQAPIVFRKLPKGLVANKYNIGYWNWELEEFPDKWLSSFQYYNEIWAPSSFCQDSISRKSPLPVIRIPLCVTVEPCETFGRQSFGIPGDKFVLLTVFDFLSGFERKNPLAVIEAFKRAFGHGSGFLVLKINGASHRPWQLEALRHAVAGYPVKIVDHVLTRQEMNALMNCCDCFVSLHRSEGFGLTLAEAMSLAKPVICTGYSGNMDFTKPANAFLVDYEMRPVGEGSDPYEPHCLWADPSVEHAASLMRTVSDSPELRLRFGKAGQAYVRKNLSPEAVGRLIRGRLEQLWRRAGRSDSHQGET